MQELNLEDLYNSYYRVKSAESERGDLIWGEFCEVLSAFEKNQKTEAGKLEQIALDYSLETEKRAFKDGFRLAIRLILEGIVKEPLEDVKKETLT